MSYDVLVIGSGPAGYVAAIRAAQLGFKTAIVERYATLGGTCLNVGCIPSKALLDSSEKYFEARKVFAGHGIRFDGLSFDLAQAVKRKNAVVEVTTKGVDLLMRNNKIDRYQGVATFLDSETVQLRRQIGEEEVLKGHYMIVATGSKAASLPGVTIDKKRIITSTEALSLQEIPQDFLVIGAGAIGLEMASVFARLGSKVTVLEYMDTALPLMDRELGKELMRVLGKELGITGLLSHKVEEAKAVGDQVVVVAADREGRHAEFRGDYCLVAVGRKPYTDGLGLEMAGIALDTRGRILVDERLRTTVPNIFAIGDVIGGMMLAHKGEEEGIFVAEIIAGQKPHINYDAIPQVVYTTPEVASVGHSEEALKSKGIGFKSGKFYFRASGRARASGTIDGFVKVLAQEKTDEILGVHMIGPRAADLISEAVVALEFRASAEDIGRCCHPHPTFSEAFKEACLAATSKRALHL